MSDVSETPFHDIESAIEYINLLLDAAQEAQRQIEGDLLLAIHPEHQRRRQGLQLAVHKLTQLASHLSTSRRILGDLRMLRRVLTSESKTLETAPL